MLTKLAVAGVLSAFLAAPAFAQYVNPASGDSPTPGVMLSGPQAIDRTPVASQSVTLNPIAFANCGLRSAIEPGSADRTELRPGVDHDPVPGVYNRTFCG
jgi:hypothetical protein